MKFEEKELINYLTALQVDKSVYEYIVYDSEIEREFARRLNERTDIKLFVKLPNWFKVDTPIGTYNPDWAIVKHVAHPVLWTHLCSRCDGLKVLSSGLRR